MHNAGDQTVSNAAVTFAIPEGVTYVPDTGPVMPGPTSITVPSSSTGIAELSLVSMIGNIDFPVNARVNDVEEIDGSPQSTRFTPQPPAVGESSFNVSTGTRTADGAAERTITVRLCNASGDPANGFAAILSAQSSPSNGVTIGSFTETAVLGTYPATVTSTSAGSKTITVEAGPSAIATVDPAGQNTAHFVAGAPEVGPGLAGLTLSSGDRVADGADAHTATVVLKDSHGNSVTGPRQARRRRPTRPTTSTWELSPKVRPVRTPHKSHPRLPAPSASMSPSKARRWWRSGQDRSNSFPALSTQVIPR